MLHHVEHVLVPMLVYDCFEPFYQIRRVQTAVLMALYLQAWCDGADA